MLAEHRAWLETVVRARMKDRNASDDILQDVAVSVLRHTTRPTSKEGVAPWLYRITLRKIINYQRTLGRQNKHLQSYAELQRSESEPEFDDSLAWLVHREQRDLLQTALNRMVASQREILMLKYSQRWSYSQLAEHLGVSEKSVEYRLLKARSSLRQLLREENVTK